MNRLLELRRATGATQCQECGKCTTLCPLASSGGFSARLIAGHDLEQEVATPGIGLRRCLTCGSCELRCPQEVRYSELVRGLREMIPESERLPAPHGGVLQAAARLAAGPEEPARDLSWIDDGLRVSQEGEIALYVGCLPTFDLVFRDDLGVAPLEIARSAIRLLNHLGIEPVLLREERCCGHDLAWSGEQNTFESLARANVEAFRKRGVRHVLTTCAECCRTWRLDYPRIVPEYRPTVEHLSEFLAARVEAGELTFADGGPTKVTYQDPCRLGRHMGVYSPPRQVLQAMPGTELLEMERAGRDAVCCGTSGFIYCDAASHRLQAERLDGAAATGAETLVTTCPKCLIHFVCAQARADSSERAKARIPVMDLTVLAASRLPGPGDEANDAPSAERRETGETR